MKARGFLEIIPTSGFRRRAQQTSRRRSLLLPRTNLFGGGRASFRNTEPPLSDIFVERLRKVSTLYNGRRDIPSNPDCLSFQDKIRLLQDDLECERELRQRVSFTIVLVHFSRDLSNPENYVMHNSRCRNSLLTMIDHPSSF